MAKFKVGQRVRFVRGVRPVAEPFIGKEGAIVVLGSNPRHWDCGVDFGIRIDLGMGVICGDCVGAMFSELEPLTDPKADSFIESIKNLPAYEEPKAPSFKERTRALQDQAFGGSHVR